MSASTISAINDLIRRYYDEQNGVENDPAKAGLPLAIPQFGAEEVIESLESLLSSWVTMGKKVRAFEEMFAKYLRIREGVMVNSGSSAGLLAISSLSSRRFKDGIRPGDEIICPAITWPTTIFPIGYFGAKPVFVDVELDTLNIEAEQVESAITKRTKAIMVAHLMGNPAAVDRIRKIADGKGIHVIEDACEAHGAKIGDKMVGTFGICSLFSFFLSHHITTIEGGMVLSDNPELLELLTSQRAHGWIREMKKSKEIARDYPQIDSRFLFYETGFNLRPTEIQGAFGIRQLPKLEHYIAIRRRIAKDWNKRLKPYEDLLTLPEERSGTRHVYFAYPIMVKEDAPFSRKELMAFLESKKIATRPVAGGNLLEQPNATLYKSSKIGRLPNARQGMRSAFFIGLHHGITKRHQDFVVDCFEEFMSSKTHR